MLTLSKRKDTELVDVILDSEFFATVCNFNYPISEYDEISKEGILHLEAMTSSLYNEDNVLYGLMVWNNRNYIPKITFKETEYAIEINIENERKLPYPAIQRTKAWLKALIVYLENKEGPRTNPELEVTAKNVFLENILIEQP